VATSQFETSLAGDGYLGNAPQTFLTLQYTLKVHFSLIKQSSLTAFRRLE
jgi:hypothetical protein